MFRPMYIESTQEIIYTYDQYLKSKHWRIVQYEFAHLVPRICVICGNPINLHIHHKTYERIGRELQWDLVYLCENCHKSWHLYLNYQRSMSRKFSRYQRRYLNK